MTYFFETYGCQMNKAESASLEQMLIQRGWTAAADVDSADMVVINTCSVRITAETRIFGRLGYLKTVKQHKEQQNLPFTLVIAGCAAERMQQKMKDEFPWVDYVLGNFRKSSFPAIITAAEKGVVLETLDTESDYVFAENSWQPGTFSSYVPIMHGCNNFCSYCIVPYVRGRETSRAPSEIFAEIASLESKNVREITLLGQNVNSYRYVDESGDVWDFPRLLNAIADKVHEIGWIRFMSSHPKDLSDKLIDVIARRSEICRHIHLPVQHGSSRILAAMNRKYTREDYLSLVTRIRNAIPDVSLSTDLLIGFPGETESDVEDVLSLMREVRYEYAFMYHYNPRPGTAAFSLPDRIPDDEKIKRLTKVIDLQLEITRAKMTERIGATEHVLVESVSRDNPGELLARTSRDAKVVFPGSQDLIGTFADIQIESVRGNTFRAVLL